jgi:LCP family protein required for cell wall assembly
VLIGGWLYESLLPSRHFRAQHIPVLAAPLPIRTTADEPEISSQSEPIEEQANTAAADKMDKEQPSEASGFNILILGMDSRDQEASRSDVIMVAHVDPVKQQINIVSVPRDTRVALPGTGMTKVNHAHFFGELQGGSKEGTEAAIGAVSHLLQIPIHYYVKTDFKGFAEAVDVIGGIEVQLPRDVLLSGHGVTLKAGTQHLNGNTALQLARERYSFAGWDFDRQADQALILKAVVKKMLAAEQLPQLPGLIKKVKKEWVDTNLSVKDAVSLALLFKEMDGGRIRHVTLPGQAVMDEDPLVGSRLWYWSADAEEVESISRNML